MSGPLNHRPEEVIQQLLVDLSLAIHGHSDWKVYAGHMPDKPDNAIGVFEVPGVKLGRSQPTGIVCEHYGIQIMCRSKGVLAWTKAKNISDKFDQLVLRNFVTLEGSVYRVNAFNRTGNLRSLGKETPTSERRLYTVEGLVSLELVSEPDTGSDSSDGSASGSA